MTAPEVPVEELAVMKEHKYRWVTITRRLFVCLYALLVVFGVVFFVAVAHTGGLPTAVAGLGVAVITAMFCAAVATILLRK